MRVINVIVHDNESGIISLDSFGIIDEQDCQTVVDEAEELYVEKCVEIKFGDGTNDTRDDLRERDFYREDLNETLDDGYVEVNGITVSIVWSSIDNIQL